MWKKIELNIDPNDSFYKGNENLYKNNYKEAIELFNTVIKEDSNNIEAYIYRAIAKFKLDLYEEAIFDCNIAIKTDCKSEITRASFSYLYPKVLPIYKKGLKIGIKDKDTLFFLGCIQLSLTQYKEAIKNFNKVIKIDNNYAKAYLKRGVAKLDSLEYEEIYEKEESIIKDFNIAIQLDKENPEPFFFLGKTYYELEQYEKALDNFNKAKKIKTIDKEFNDFVSTIIEKEVHFTKIYLKKKQDEYCREGYKKIKLLDLKEAENFYNKAIKIHHFYSQYAHEQKGNIYFLLKEYKQAISEYDNAINNETDEYELSQIYIMRGNSNFFLKNYISAIHDYNSALQIREYSITYENRGDAHAALGYYELAIADYNTSLTFEHLDKYKKALILLKKGEIEEKIQKYDDAINTYILGITLENIYREEFHFRLGNIYFRQKKYNKAFNEFNLAIFHYENLNFYYNIDYCFKVGIEYAQKDKKEAGSYFARAIYLDNAYREYFLDYIKTYSEKNYNNNIRLEGYKEAINFYKKQLSKLAKKYAKNDYGKYISSL